MAVCSPRQFDSQTVQRDGNPVCKSRRVVMVRQRHRQVHPFLAVMTSIVLYLDGGACTNGPPVLAQGKRANDTIIV